MEATWSKAFSDARTEGNVRETSKVTGGGVGGEGLNSGEASNWDLCFDQDIREEGKTIAWEKNIDDFSGTPKWCFNFVKRGLSMRMWTNLAQKLPSAHENQVLVFHFYVISLQKTTFSCPKSPAWMRSHLHFMCYSTELWTWKGQRPCLSKLVLLKKTHFTVVLACCAAGTKPLPMIIFKRKTFPKQKIPSGVIVHVREKGWMNEKGMKIWFNKVWSRSTEELLKWLCLFLITSKPMLYKVQRQSQQTWKPSLLWYLVGNQPTATS